MMGDLLAGLARHTGARIGLILLALVVAPALLAPWLPLADPTLTAPAERMLAAGTPGHLLGTDSLGRDFLSRLIWGARSSLLVGLVATLVAGLVGSLIGLMAGFFGRLTDTLLMRGVDVLMAFPYLLLALAIVAALGPGLANAMLAIAVANLPFFARAVRGTVLEIRHRAFIDAARLAGHRAPWILAVEVLPNLAPTLLLLMTTTLGWMILETAGLSFLGLGAQPPAADLGAMLGQGRELLTTYPRVAVLPGLVILVLVIGINLVGDGLRDLLDPRLRALSRSAARRTSPDAAAIGPAPASVVQVAAESAASRPPPLLRVQALSVMVPSERGSAIAVDRLDLELRPGERVGLVGESGSGKSLTALALLGFAPIGGRLAGQVLLDGGNLLTLNGRALRGLRGRRIAYIPQAPTDALDPLLRVGEQLEEAIAAHASGRENAQTAPNRVDALLAMVGLDQVTDVRRRFPHELSGGQAQRVAIAMALAHEPDLLIADEATTALDVTVQAEILALLAQLSRGRERALLFVSHDLALVAGLCERVLVFYAGQLVEDAPIESLLTAPAHPYTRALLACSPELGHPEKPLSAISGQPPSPDELTQGRGCRFAPRCPIAQPDCAQIGPGLTALAANHFARCLCPLVRPRAAHVGLVEAASVSAGGEQS